jgi:hypothetical protein
LRGDGVLLGVMPEVRAPSVAAACLAERAHGTRAAGHLTGRGAGSAPRTALPAGIEDADAATSK